MAAVGRKNPHFIQIAEQALAENELKFRSSRFVPGPLRIEFIP